MRLARRCITDEEEANRLLHAWRDSQMDIRTFCAAHGIDGRSLRSWLDKNKGTDIPSVRLLELMPVEETRAVQTKATYRLTIGAVSLEFDEHFREETLVRLLAVLR